MLIAVSVRPITRILQRTGQIFNNARFCNKCAYMYALFITKWFIVGYIVGALCLVREVYTCMLSSNDKPYARLLVSVLNKFYILIIVSVNIYSISDSLKIYHNHKYTYIIICWPVSVTWWYNTNKRRRLFCTGCFEYLFDMKQNFNPPPSNFLVAS